MMFMTLLIPLLTVMVAATDSHEEHSLQCSSLPSFDNSDIYIYFGCSCRENEKHGGVFSISRFAHNLTQRISDKSLVVDFRDCASLTVLLDQELLYWTRSPVFRPDLSIVEINVDNVDQLKLLPGLLEPSSDVSEYSLPPVLERMTVHLYTVTSVLVGPGVPLDLLTSEADCPDCAGTELTINTTGDSGYHFNIQGFREDNVFFITEHPESTIEQKMSQIESVLRDVGSWMMKEARQVSLWLCVSVFIVSIGIGTMIIAIVKRHRLAIEAAIYGSIGSLKRLRKRGSSRNKSVEEDQENNNNSSNNNNNNITTATEVAFFPRYSVVNKSWREEKSNKKKPDQKEKVKSEKDAGTQEKEKEVSKSHLDKSVRGDKNNANSTKQSLYEIISTMRFKTQQNKESSLKRPGDLQTSFYFAGGNQSTGSSKYDLTLAKTLSKKIQVEVHQPNYEAKDKSVINVEDDEDKSSSSPQPLIKESSENLYSFNTLREKCRQLIANSRNNPGKTKL